MIRLVLLAGVLLLVYLAIDRARGLSPAGRRVARQYGWLGVPAVLLLWLIVTGRLSWLFALLAPVMLLLGRAWRMLMMVAVVRRMMGHFGVGQPRAGAGAGAGAEPPPPGPDAPPASQPSSKLDEAYAVLGLQRGASRQDVLDAHKRLIQKMHPDLGGSDYLAASINGARDLLLRHIRS